jgi:outer membrane protein TolC
MRRLLLAACFAGATTSSLAAQQPAPAAPTGAGADSLRLSRAQAIAQALARNTQLDIAREQTAQARARRVQGVAIPDPSLTAATDEQSRFFGFDRSGTRPVELGLAIPFPDKFRLKNRIGVADIRANEQNYRLQQQLVAFDASQAYDQLLLALRRRSDLTEALTLSQDFLRRTQARFDAGTAARVDVIKARVEAAGSQNDLIANEREIANAQTALNRAIGRVAFAPIAPTESPHWRPPRPPSADQQTIAETDPRAIPQR